MDSFELLVIGGGINGAAIARDAAMRGLTVLLVERDDLAAHTSSASSKLIHGGLRYLERLELRLVRESLREREVLLRTAPHIVRPLRFVLPDASGGRPTWMLRAGLRLYDGLAGRSGLPRSHRIGSGDPAAAPLKPGCSLLGYWDAWVDDARLVVLNALAAAEHGAEIATRSELLMAAREGGRWRVHLSGGRKVMTSMIVNATGPWVADVLSGRLESRSRSRVRLIKGSHILVPRLWQGDQAYIVQQPDGRVVFALPFGEFSLVGTTDIPVAAAANPAVSPEEAAYLCEAVNRYFVEPVEPAQIIWSYAGVRALHDDGSAAAKDVTRDYHLELDGEAGAKLLSVFGGKITTARALAEEALERLGAPARSATATTPLPGGEAADPDPRWLPPDLLMRLRSAYGSRLSQVLGGGASLSDLGRHFGAGLSEREVRYLQEVEFARTAEDILWRRTKLGLRMSPAEQQALRDYLGG